MFKAKKKFVEEETPAKRLLDRWDQQVFFLTRKFPNARNEIAAIMKAEAPRGAAFEPTESALEKLAELYSELQQPRS